MKAQPHLAPCLRMLPTLLMHPRWPKALSLSLSSLEAHLSLSRFVKAMVDFMLCGSYPLVPLSLGKPPSMLKSTFMHLHIFTKKSSFNGKLATHT